MNKLIALAVATVLIALAPAANATVVWTFYETGCTGCLPMPPPPIAIATLTLSGPDSAGSAIWEPGTHAGIPVAAPPMLFGDTTNFSLFFSTAAIVPPSYGYNNFQCGLVVFAHSVLCDYDISWSEQNGQLNAVAINLNSQDTQIGNPRFQTFGLTGGSVATDGTIGNCTISQCQITGFWQNNLQVPEPMSASLLLSGLLGLALTRQYLRLSRGGGKIG